MTRAVVLDKELPDLLANLTPFRTEAKTGLNDRRFEDGALAGYAEPRSLDGGEGIGALETGLLTDDWYAKFIRDYGSEIVDYVIYSYDTVIAWHCREHSYAVIPGGIGKATWEQVPAHWEVTDTMITTTTAKHQWRIILALREKGLL